jgi:hypothetical protein
MIDSIDRYYWYRTFDGSMKIKIVFKQEVGRFFVVKAKKQRNKENFLKPFYRSNNTIDSVCTDGSMAISQRRLL